MFTLVAATENLQCSTGQRERGAKIRSIGCYVVARSRTKSAIKDSNPDEGDAMSTPWRPSHSLALAHASIGYLFDASPALGVGRGVIAMIVAMVARNADLAAWYRHRSSTLLQQHRDQAVVRAAGRIETSAAQGLLVQLVGDVREQGVILK
jgi:hypothetical protein